MRIEPKSLLNTKYLPNNYKLVRALSRTARAYHALQPYPSYSNMTKNWVTDDRGPYPRCRPFVQNIVNKGATWLFGKPVTFRVAEETQKPKKKGVAPKSKYEDMNELINAAWTDNDMTSMARVSAIIGANSGGVYIHFSYDENKEQPIQIDVLDPAEQVRLYWDPKNIQKLLMARIQYPIYNEGTGETYWYREDWTDETYQTYKPVAMTTITPSAFIDPYQLIDQVDQFEKWEIATTEPNKFGIIPGWYVRNRKNGSTYGDGDLWAMFDIIDQINFTHNLAHIDNQKSIDPTKALIDLAAPVGEQPGANQSNEVEVYESKDASKQQGKIELLQTNAALRPHLDAFAKELKKDLFDAVGSVELSPEEVTNKGNLTAAVMTQMYAPLVERTGEKRQCYGEDGYCVFFERMAIGLSNIKAEGWEAVEDIQIVWPPYFEETEGEKGQLADRQSTLVENGLTTRDKAIRAVAKSDGIQDIDAHIADVDKEHEENKAEEQKQMEAQNTPMNRQRAGMGGSK